MIKRSRLTKQRREVAQSIANVKTKLQIRRFAGDNCSALLAGHLQNIRYHFENAFGIKAQLVMTVLSLRCADWLSSASQ